jgi:hypothetical protein
METGAELERKILQDIAKTGYPLEIRASLVLEAQGWSVTHNPAYLDPEEQKAREIDIRAVMSWDVEKPGGSKHFLACNLLVECKKSTNPWVFFVTPVARSEQADHLRYYSSIENLVEKLWTKGDYVLDLDFLRSSQPRLRSDRCARTYYEPFKGQEKGDRSPTIFRALSAATKAIHHEATGWRRLFDEDIHLDLFTIFWYPLVIFDGPMYEASVSLEGGISLSQSAHVQVPFNYVTAGADPGGEPERFMVDVVQEPFLAHYLSSQAAFHAAAAQKMESCYRDGTVRLQAKEPSTPEQGK